jgi:multidrug efflux pump subunit AcrA (membrane-fusion protein)
MENAKNNLNLRSEEVQEIMQRTPSWVVRWGITTIFVIIILGLFLCWLIKYPEIITGTVKLTTSIPPAKIISQTTGKITHLYVKDGEEIKAGTVMAEIENPLSYEGIKYIETYIALLKNAINQNNHKLPLPDNNSVALGDLQTVFNDLQKDIIAYNLNRQYKVEDMQIVELNQRLNQQKNLLAIANKMIAITEKELENAKQKYESDMVLFKNNVISKQEFYQKQSEFNSKQIQLEQLKQSKVENEVLINSLRLQLSEGEFDREYKNQGSIDAIKSYQKTIENYIYGWQQKYRFVATTDGKVSYLNTLHVNQYIKAGDEVFALFQPSDSIVGLAEVPVAGFGKVKTGQTVHILLDNFPYQDYGVLTGSVKKIAILPNVNYYRVEIALPNGMNSGHDKPLKFTPEMTGFAEIVTDDKTVIQRIFKSILKLFDSK